jgi:23S rRNA pseudouridine1911/1915/1917 synthase
VKQSQGWRAVVQPQDEGERLDRALCRWLSEAVGAPVTRGQAKDLLDQGAVYLNGQRVRIASKTLRPGARVEVRAPLDALRKPTSPRWLLTPDRVLFEDEDIIAIDKPPGLPTQATRDPDRDHLFAAVQRYAAQSSRTDPDRAYVGLHHRLDTDASGVVLMTRSRRANTQTMTLFRDRLAHKTYLALTHPHPDPALPPDDWHMSGPLRRPGPEGQADDGRWAESDCHIAQRFPHGLLVHVHPHTGRRHQVRLHLALSLIPILGDATYGARSPHIHPPRLMLHAHSLQFTHPITSSPMTITSPLPDDFTLTQSRL